MSALGDLIQTYLDLHAEAKKKDIAAAAGVSPQLLSGWVNGKVLREFPDPDTIKGLAKALEMPEVEVVLAISTDLGLSTQRVDEADLPPGVAVTIGALRQLSPDHARSAAAVIASLLETERTPAGRHKRG